MCLHWFLVNNRWLKINYLQDQPVNLETYCASHFPEIHDCSSKTYKGYEKTVEYDLVKSVEVTFKMKIKGIAWNKQVNCKDI